MSRVIKVSGKTDFHTCLQYEPITSSSVETTYCPNTKLCPCISSIVHYWSCLKFPLKEVGHWWRTFIPWLTMKVTVYKGLRLITLLVCTIIFLIMVKSQWDVFDTEPTGTSLKAKSEWSIPFPGISICDQHLQYRKALEELGFPMNPFQRPQEITANPLLLYKWLEIYNISVMDTIWKYYFTLDQVLDIISDTDVTKKNFLCRIGGVSCTPMTTTVNATNDEGEIFEFKSKTLPVPADPHGLVEVHVPAGKWISRVLADSSLGNNFMCHTLVPNVSVDFGRERGNLFSIKWQNDYFETSPYWQVYVHDRHEDVVLREHALESLHSITVTKVGSSANGGLRKASIYPRLQLLPEPSEVHPCEDADDYSRNNCNLKHGWRVKTQSVEDHYGRNYTCEIPGLVLDPKDHKPVCQTYYDQDSGGKGLESLLSLRSAEFDDKVPRLLSPPVGNYKASSQCKSRCSTYSYSLVEENVAKSDRQMDGSDLLLYFPSNTVETWKEYRLQSGMDFVAGLGGSLGLLLGFSVMTLVLEALEWTQKLCQLTRRRLQVTHNDLKRRRRL